jgi:hypothetical protein
MNNRCFENQINAIAIISHNHQKLKNRYCITLYSYFDSFFSAAALAFMSFASDSFYWFGSFSRFFSIGFSVIVLTVVLVVLPLTSDCFYLLNL